jgi:hypothetical protein
MNKNLPKNILYWSPKCPYSTNLIQRIKDTPIMENIILCSVHDKRYPLPPFVKSVPTLWFSVQKKTLTDDGLTQWVNAQLYQLQQSQQNQQLPTQPNQPYPNQQEQQYNGRQYNNQQNQRGPAVKKVHTGDDDLAEEKKRTGPITDFNPAEMGTSFSESYSFLDNPDATSTQNFTFIGEAFDVPPVTTIKGNSADFGDFPSNKSDNNNNNNNNNNNMSNMNNGMNGGGGGRMNNGGMNGGMNGGGNYNPFADNSGSSRSNPKEDELKAKLDQLMQSRDMEDSLGGAYR